MSSSTPSSENYIGTALFLSYILAALYLTIRITSSLWRQYQSRFPTLPPQTLRQIYASTFLALVSFASLSYHMLFFLIKSYLTWASSKAIHLPTQDTRSLSQSMWHWMLDSSLFDTFAKDLVREDGAWFWTRMSVLGTLGWGIWMARQARETCLGWKTIYPYIALSQILPVSFTALLFRIRILLSPPSQADATLKGASRPNTSSPKPNSNFIRTTFLTNALPIALPFLLLPLLDILRASTTTSFFLPLLLTTRLFLIIPYFLPFDLNLEPKPLMPIVALVASYGAASSALWELGKRGEMMRGVGANEAVGALGWDFVVGVVVVGGIGMGI